MTTTRSASEHGRGQQPHRDGKERERGEQRHHQGRHALAGAAHRTGKALQDAWVDGALRLEGQMDAAAGSNFVNQAHPIPR